MSRGRALRVHRSKLRGRIHHATSQSRSHNLATSLVRSLSRVTNQGLNSLAMSLVRSLSRVTNQGPSRPHLVRITNRDRLHRLPAKRHRPHLSQEKKMPNDNSGLGNRRIKREVGVKTPTSFFVDPRLRPQWSSLSTVNLFSPSVKNY